MASFECKRAFKVSRSFVPLLLSPSILCIPQSEKGLKTYSHTIFTMRNNVASIQTASRDSSEYAFAIVERNNKPMRVCIAEEKHPRISSLLFLPPSNPIPPLTPPLWYNFQTSSPFNGLVIRCYYLRWFVDKNNKTSRIARAFWIYIHTRFLLTLLHPI